MATLEQARGWWQLGRDILLTMCGVGILVVEVWRPGPAEAWVALIAAGLMGSSVFTRKGDREDTTTSTPTPGRGTT